MLPSLMITRTQLICIILVGNGLCGIGAVNTSTGRIVGGIETTISQIPYLVNLRRNGEFTCGGSLITRQCVLTAAHCVHNVPASGLTVHAGSSRLSEAGNVRNVQAYFVSPLYSSSTLDMDAAILKLQAPLQGQNIATVSLCQRRPNDGEPVRISGWGVTSEYNRNPPNQVRTTEVFVVPKEKCVQEYAGKARLSSTMFCATVAGEKDSCSGDSGGPLVYNGQLCGIVSWGIGCARNYPGVYTNVASLRVRTFIARTLMKNCT